MNLRKAANYAIDRPACSASAARSPASGPTRSCPRAWAASSDSKMYPLAGLQLREGQGSRRQQLRQRSASTRPTSVVGQALGQVVKYNLTQMGCNVTVKLFQGFQLYVADGTKGEPFDAALAGWNQDYPDPYDFIDVLLNGNNIHAANNNNLAYLNVPSLNKLMDAANKMIRRRPLQGVRRPRPDDHVASTPRGPPTTTATSASSSRLEDRWLHLPARQRERRPQHLLHQVEGSFA